MNRKVLVTGGAGYVGVELVSSLLDSGFDVVVYDLFWFLSEQYFNKFGDSLKVIKGDIRDTVKLRSAMDGCSDLIHLACISNDPSCDLNPELAKSINYDCFEQIVRDAKASSISRFIFASSSSVYGLREEPNVTEDLELRPLTDYSKYKMLCEEILKEYSDESFTTVSLRPATVCGYSDRMRLDVVVNILTNFAVNRGLIKVFGGEQLRPNIHIKDMVRCYLALLMAPREQINGKSYNVGADNYKVIDIAKIISKATNVKNIEVTPTDDNRSYHISSLKIKNELGFQVELGVEDAVTELVQHFKDGKIPNSFEDIKYFNVKYLQENKIDENSSRFR
ncbi:UDP-glucose 4-epimerase [Halobacteriovorax marinus]|uniref:NAD-dependent epimerase/dehydratase family protein n=1 Tax=Halobacteriovorax marinus TaxID=97084 RepID=UPI000BC34E16|nr:SDR family oxidoreductase [Halobacteriovorax marinus]ATH09190.1 UDP-glucose 4-epimerase [Halobacteriovorax marinus]